MYIIVHASIISLLYNVAVIVTENPILLSLVRNCYKFDRVLVLERRVIYADTRSICQK